MADDVHGTVVAGPAAVAGVDVDAQLARAFGGGGGADGQHGEGGE